MKNINFRDLTADDIEVRIATVKEAKNGKKGGVSLLLYKTARCDMNILDETVGNINWQREHTDHKNNLYCKIGININYNNPSEPPVWVWKEDCGAESYTEKEKGEASDSFKRAGFNWGIGRELYTSPFIWIDDSKCEIKQVGNTNKFTCYDRFFVSKICIKEKKIIALEIKKQTKNGGSMVVFSYGLQNAIENTPYEPKIPEVEPYTPVFCNHCNKSILGGYGKDGKKYTAEEVKKRCGGLCTDCYKKVNGIVTRKEDE